MRILCWLGMHRYGKSTLWPKSRPGLVRYETRCRRCHALICFSCEPFVK